VCDCVRSAVEKSLLANEDSRAIDMRVQTTLVPAETTAGTPETAQAAPRSQASTRPDKLVRVDAQSRTLRDLLSAPSRKNRRRSNATFDLGDTGTRDVHEGLREILKEHVVIGWIDAERILVQKATKLYLLDVGELSRDLFVQRLGGPRDNGPEGRVTLRPPPSVAELLMIALSTQEKENEGVAGRDDPSTINEEVAGLLCELLAKHAEWLEAMFGVLVSNNGERLVQLPDPGLEESCAPLDASRLPEFLLRLAADVDWTEEGARRSGVASALGELYRLREGDDERRSVAVWTAVKSSLTPSRRLATDGSVIELTRLEQLYRTFERC